MTLVDHVVAGERSPRCAQTGRAAGEGWPTSRQVRMALVQFESAMCDPATNARRACSFIERAGERGADIVVLPELFSTGYQLSIVGPRLQELAEGLSGPTVTALRGAARRAHCYVVAGLALTYDEPGIVFNSAVVIDRDGELTGTYDKEHLWSLERSYFRAGSRLPVFETDFGKVGVMICYDMGFPEVARMLALKGAELIICPSAWCEQDHDVWDINAPARALENTVFLAAVNRYGREEDLYMGGHTLACDPRGRVLAEVTPDGEGMLVVDVDLAQVVTNRVTSPYLRDRRPEMYGDVLLP